MDIVKAFENNDMHLHITIQGTPEEPLFRASDIGELLEIVNIRNSIKDFDQTEKHGVHIVDAIGRNQETTFLTEKGLYKILFKSRKPVAEKFTNWVCEVIKEIRLNGKYELEKQVLEANKQITDTLSQKEQTLLKNFSKKSIVYIGYCEDNIVKFGYTDDIETRIKDHKKEIKEDWTPIYVYESFQNKEIERKIKQHKTIKIITKIYNGKKQTELIQLNAKFTINDLDKIILQIKYDIESSKDYITEIDKLKAENAELKLKLKHQEDKEVSIIDIQTNNMDNLNTKTHEIKKAVCYNFLVDLIAKEIINNDGKTDINIKLTIDEIFELYKQFRISNRYQDPIYNETYEKSLITKAFNEVNGIKNTYKTIDGVQSRAKLFDVSLVSEWICENLEIPKRFRSIFRTIAKDTVFTSIYRKILNPEIEEKTKHVYSFLLNILDRYKENTFVIKNTILNEQYLKFIMHHDFKKLTMTKVLETLKEIDGITLKQRIKDGESKYCKGLQFERSEIDNWVKENIDFN